VRQYRLLRAGAWELSLPADWSQAPSSDDRSLYFETADGAKGLYVTTWALAEHERRPVEDVVEAFLAADLQSMKQSAQQTWRMMSQYRDESAHVCVAITDLFAAEKFHRTILKILAWPPTIVTASFHDYACTDYEASYAYFQDIIDSLQLQRAIEG
jgi:hypothetical protein